MPSPRTDIDRDAVAASVALKGIRPTSRETGIPLGTVQRIAAAGNVIVPGAMVRTVTERTTAVRSIQDGQKPAHALITDELQRLGSKSKLAVAKYGARVLPHAAKRAKTDPESALLLASDVKSVVSSLQTSNIPGFERENTQNAGISLTFNSLDPSNVVLLPETPVIELEQIAPDPMDDPMF